MEDGADTFIRKSRRQLPHIARFCLVATFIEDGFRLMVQWSDQISYINTTWGTPYFIGLLFILMNLFGQFIGSFCVLSRTRVRAGVACLGVCVIAQVVGYGVYIGVFVLRNISLIGSLAMIVAETLDEKTDKFLAGLPSTGENVPQKYLLLVGRLLVVCMFVSLLLTSVSILQFLLGLACSVLVLCVALGYRTKVSAIALVMVLTLLNFYFNSFWMAPYGSGQWDYMKYDFFQTWSIVGGLLFIVAYGPGGVSVDDYKKKY